MMTYNQVDQLGISYASFLPRGNVMMRQIRVLIVKGVRVLSMRTRVTFVCVHC